MSCTEYPYRVIEIDNQQEIRRGVGRMRMEEISKKVRGERREWEERENKYYS